MGKVFLGSTLGGGLRETYYSPSAPHGDQGVSGGFFTRAVSALPESSKGLHADGYVSAAKWVWDRPWDAKTNLLRRLMASQLLGMNPEELCIRTLVEGDAIAFRLVTPSTSLIFDEKSRQYARAALERVLVCRRVGLMTPDAVKLTADDWLFFQSVEPKLKARSADVSIIDTVLAKLDPGQERAQLDRLKALTYNGTTAKRMVLKQVQERLSWGTRLESLLLEMEAESVKRSRVRSRGGFVSSDIPLTMTKLLGGTFGFTALEVIANQLHKPELTKPLEYLAPLFLAHGLFFAFAPTLIGVGAGGVGQQLGHALAQHWDLDETQTRNLEIVGSSVAGFFATATSVGKLGLTVLAPQIELAIILGGVAMAGCTLLIPYLFD